MVGGMPESDADSQDRLAAGRERLPKAALFDLDGALADISLLPVMQPGDPRLKVLESRPDRHRLVPAHDWVVELAAEQRRAGIAVIVLASRRERWRERSKEWLVMQRVPFDALIMRADTGDRPEVELKRTALAAIQQQYEVVLAVDDNPNVIRSWSDHGIATRLVPGWRKQPTL
jgi:beta-phosphoglucomutase-like phosphatase (HAD superfamily)